MIVRGKLAVVASALGLAPGRRDVRPGRGGRRRGRRADGRPGGRPDRCAAGRRDGRLRAPAVPGRLLRHRRDGRPRRARRDRPGHRDSRRIVSGREAVRTGRRAGAAGLRADRHRRGRHPGSRRRLQPRHPARRVQPYIDAAHRHGALLLLDIQPGPQRLPDRGQALGSGRSRTRTSASRSTPSGGWASTARCPAGRIGSVGAAEVNRVSAWLRDLTAARRAAAEALRRCTSSAPS